MIGGLGRAVVQFGALMLVGLVAGATFGIWQGYDPAGLSAAAFVEMHQNAVRGLNVLLPALVLTGAILVAILTFLSRRRRSIFWLYVAALGFIIAGGAVTRLINQPINAEVMTWTAETLPQTWTALRDRWWVLAPRADAAGDDRTGGADGCGACRPPCLITSAQTEPSASRQAVRRSPVLSAPPSRVCCG